MSPEEVLAIYTSLEQEGIHLWLDGGWGVDALLGRQTRPHQDLDLAVQDKDLESLRDILSRKGFQPISRNEEEMWDLVLSNPVGKEIEVHAFGVDDAGRIIEQDYWNGYSEDSLSGAGSLLSVPVKCVSLTQLVKTHDKNQRKLKDTDLHDMELLQREFGVDFP